MIDFEELRALAAEAKAADEGPQTLVYLFNPEPQTPPTSTLHRIGGALSAERAWPTWKGVPKTHLLTVDLAQTPSLRIGPLADVRAFSLFVSDPEANRAYEPHTEETTVWLLRSDEIRNEDALQVPQATPASSSSFDLVPVEVPARVFEDDALDFIDEDDVLVRLWGALASVPGYIGGGPTWIQHPEHKGTFLGQFSDELIDMNLGDAGVMYIFADTAFWQCS
ncbi:MAG: hypothetical protein AAF809_14405 [Bacteroidota bacterium]